ncbi:unnamed protein product [Symbiodinium sp. CCMP2456]|nr:unnamed protein product [Symbiodinium sp. CCMP2456]
MAVVLHGNAARHWNVASLVTFRHTPLELIVDVYEANTDHIFVHLVPRILGRLAAPPLGCGCHFVGDMDDFFLGATDYYVDYALLPECLVGGRDRLDRGCPFSLVDILMHRNFHRLASSCSSLCHAYYFVDYRGDFLLYYLECCVDYVDDFLLDNLLLDYLDGHPDGDDCEGDMMTDYAVEEMMYCAPTTTTTSSSTDPQFPVVDVGHTDMEGDVASGLPSPAPVSAGTLQDFTLQELIDANVLTGVNPAGQTESPLLASLNQSLPEFALVHEEAANRPRGVDPAYDMLASPAYELHVQWSRRWRGFVAQIVHLALEQSNQNAAEAIATLRDREVHRNNMENARRLEEMRRPLGVHAGHKRTHEQMSQITTSGASSSHDPPPPSLVVPARPPPPSTSGRPSSGVPSVDAPRPMMNPTTPYLIPSAPGWNIEETPQYANVPDVDDVLAEIMSTTPTSTILAANVDQTGMISSSTTTSLVDVVGGDATGGIEDDYLDGEVDWGAEPGVRPAREDVVEEEAEFDEFDEPEDDGRGVGPIETPRSPSGMVTAGSFPLPGRAEALAQRIAYLILRDLLAILEDVDAMTSASRTPVHAEVGSTGPLGSPPEQVQPGDFLDGAQHDSDGDMVMALDEEEDGEAQPAVDYASSSAS